MTATIPPTERTGPQTPSPASAPIPGTGTGDAVRRCVCGQSEGIRPYPCGWRCARHTPAALAGQPEPDQVAAEHRAAVALLADTLDATPVYPHPPGQGGPCARCGARHHRYGVGGQPLCPTCRTPTRGRGDAVSGHALDTGGA